MTDNVTPNDNNNDAPKWWVDEGVPGTGDRPEWLGDKFKSAADLARSYSELEKRVGNAPENYDFSKSKYIDPEFASFKDLQEYAKSKKVPQDVMDKMLESVDKYFDEFNYDPNEELQRFGDNAKERLTTLNNWAKANLSEESFVALTSNLRTADAVKALEELRNKVMTNNTVVPSGNDVSGTGAPNLKEVQEELNNNLDKYKTDPKYRKEIQAKLQSAAKSSDYVDKAW